MTLVKKENNVIFEDMDYVQRTSYLLQSTDKITFLKIYTIGQALIKQKTHLRST